MAGCGTEMATERLKKEIERTARHHDPQSLFLLRTVPGIGATLGLVILYEIQSIDRFQRVQEFCSYSRLVKCQHESSGKRLGVVHFSVFTLDYFSEFVDRKAFDMKIFLAT
jgi:transposase